MSIEIKCVSDFSAELGEGAVWDDRDQCLWWVDIPQGLIHRYDPEDKSHLTYEWGEDVGCLAVREQGGLVLATRTGFWFFDPKTGERKAIADPESDLANHRFNDGMTDTKGRLWAGTLADGATSPTGTVYCLDENLNVRRWKGGFRVINGMAFSPDGTLMYYADTYPTIRQIWQCEFNPETGEPGESQVFFDTNKVEGRPDGGTVDAEGYYWQAGVGGWAMYRISPDGEHCDTIKMPVERPTKATFGGPNLDVLYVTTAAPSPKSDTPQPDAGRLFAITGLGVKGLPQARFPA